MNQQGRYQQAKKVTLIGAFINALLGLIKIIGGTLFHSHALIADGVHSFSDLLTDVMVVFASKYGSQDADLDHPYGHQRIETAATLLLALLLILAGTGLAWNSLEEFIKQEVATPNNLALIIALLSILANEALYHYTLRIGKAIHSPLVIANAWHHRSDAASSIVVALGLTGSLFGFPFLDAVAAIIVSLMIIKMGINYGWDSVKELVDTAVEPKMLEKIRAIIESVDGVERIHQLRTRSMGSSVLIDVHIIVSPFISVSEGHFIAQHVDRALLEQLPAVKDVTVHVDPEDDEITCPSFHLPNRKRLEKNLLLKWQKDFPGLENWQLHYLDGKLIIDLYCTNQFTHWQDLKERVEKDLKSQKDFGGLRFFSEQGIPL